MSADQQSSNKGEFTATDLHNIKSLIDQRGDNDGYTPTFLQVIAEKIDYRLEQIRKIEELEAKRKQAVPLVVNDFSKVKNGTLVRDCGFGTFCAPRIGLVVDMHFFKDDLCGVVCWPVIHWQDRCSPDLTHPSRPELYDGSPLPKITMNENQQDEDPIIRKGADHE